MGGLYERPGRVLRLWFTPIGGGEAQPLASIPGSLPSWLEHCSAVGEVVSLVGSSTDNAAAWIG